MKPPDPRNDTPGTYRRNFRFLHEMVEYRLEDAPREALLELIQMIDLKNLELREDLAAANQRLCASREKE